ncbi:MAG TPA: YjdF family protein [Aggregatilineaceae bacterium]|nr:YjdF family protein [Aggregatilineaceae bacterium]
MNFTVYFDAPYWVGVLEDQRDGLLFAVKHIFGAEPSDQLVYEFLLAELPSLQARMTVGVPVEAQTQKRINPKRMQREARRALADNGIRTKAQEAIQQQFEVNKQERKQTSREQRDAEREHKRDMAREKALKKHRGR